jgi:putative cardiolipin synthase
MWLTILALIVLAALVAVAAYGRFASRPGGAPSSAFAVSDTQTALDVAIAPLLARKPGESGLRLLTDNTEAFALRAAASRSAQRSLDLQYYYWKDDLTGGLLANEVIKAADRGVRVRLLLDDINVWGRDSNYRALDRHPNIEVRLFNPIRQRGGALLRGIEMVVRFWSVNRRMHNKAWIVDGRLAFVGGRNVGDAYFDADEASNFRDMDLLVLGPAVREAEIVFDRYWNSAMVAPIRALAVSRRANLGKLRERLARVACAPRAAPYLGSVEDGAPAQKMLLDVRGIHWTAAASIVSDPPEKASSAQGDGWLIDAILPVIGAALRSLEITSPYFIPLDSGARLLLRLAGNGVAISVLTNSLAATDVAAVHGAYMRYREPLIAGGIRLFELRVRHAQKDMSLFGSRGASLHTKAFVVDGLTGFVGSFNFDPRSASLNTEMGILFEHAGLAREMQAVFAEETASKRSYRVVLEDGRIGWKEEAGALLRREPDASLRRRAVATAISLLPVESQL